MNPSSPKKKGKKPNNIYITFVFLALKKSSPFDSYDRFLKSLKRDLILHASGIIITHPFQVISIRMMAQFVGRETIYKYDQFMFIHFSLVDI